jgi:hypothetical protein
LNNYAIGIVAGCILLTGLVVPYDAFAATKFESIASNHDDCLKYPSDNLDKKSDPDRKGHKVVKKAPVKKEPPKKTPAKKDPPKKVIPKAPAKKR